MRERYVSELFPDARGYIIREDGKVFQKVNGDEVLPNSQGVIRIPKRTRGHLTMSLHRLVAMAFVENPDEYYFVAFKDGNKDNVMAQNLKWVKTASAVRRAHVGKMAERIIELKEGGLKTSRVCELLGVTPQYVNRVWREWNKS